MPAKLCFRPTESRRRSVARLRFTATPLVHDRAPPLLGEHSVEILRDIGRGQVGDHAVRRLNAFRMA
jgi:crotonobetainyl-CoA:carnitine CoA-transferase CaiB-like acyl-CoA transferase